MKKFVFSLKAVYKYKLTVEKMQKADLSRAEHALRELREKERLLNEDFARAGSERDEVLKRHTDIIEELEEYDRYFRYLREAKKELAAKIVRAENIRDMCRVKLLATMKELKTYRKLREEQYRQYLKDVATEEEKEMGDLVSFAVVSGVEK
ncbi:MAG: flagellar FliJ family protein [Oscillospiraceae bacterium]|nr:flagellar FliJ family protein [Oscillospiraceae bacterium]